MARQYRGTCVNAPLRHGDGDAALLPFIGRRKGGLLRRGISFPVMCQTTAHS